MAVNNFWDKRVNLDNKPSVENRTHRIIMELMDRDDLAMGVALEKLIKTSPVYIDILEELGEYDKTILPE